MVAAAVSIAVGEHTSGAIILAIVGLRSVSVLFNEYRSEQTLASLRSRTGRRATVLRDGGAVEMAATELVRGDVCLLQVGDVIPADLRLLEVSELTIDEAALLGRGLPGREGDRRRSRQSWRHPCELRLPRLDRPQRRGVRVVVATGMQTRLGAVAGGLQERQPPTAFQRGLSGFAGFLPRSPRVLTVSIFVINAALGRPMLETLLFALAIAVGLTPQLLPAIVTVSLSTGARRMARKEVLVKRLVAIEDLGDADMLFTDKTGTLTEGEIRCARRSVRQAFDAELVRLALLASESHFDKGRRPRDDTRLGRSGAGSKRASPRLNSPAAPPRRAALHLRAATSLGGHRDRGATAPTCKGAAEEILAAAPRCGSTGHSRWPSIAARRSGARPAARRRPSPARARRTSIAT